MKALFSIIIFFILSSCSSTETDAERLAKLKYMKIADGIDCSNQIGTTLEERICLNLEFQKIDSVMNNKLDSLQDILPSDKAHNLETEQEKWLIERRKKSEESSDGFRGHVLGIIYLKTMINITNNRISTILNKYN